MKCSVCWQGILCNVPSTSSIYMVNQSPTCNASHAFTDKLSRCLLNLGCLVLVMFRTLKDSGGILAQTNNLGDCSNTGVSSPTSRSLVLWKPPRCVRCCITPWGETEWSVILTDRSPSYCDGHRTLPPWILTKQRQGRLRVQVLE